MLNIILFGPPGSGKGTQSEKIVEKYDLLHTSTGDLLRAEVGAKTKLGLAAKEFMNKGELVPDEVIIGMIEKRIDENTDVKGFIFDGFPRTVAQAEALDKLLEAKNIPIKGLIALKVSKKELVQRILERGKTSGRPDDKNEELIETRVSEYNNKTKAVADYYASQSKQYEVEGIGGIDEIFTNLSKKIDSLLIEVK
jgi:adenylate kinase